jgi:RNA-directed DNA polymerase
MLLIKGRFPKQKSQGTSTVIKGSKQEVESPPGFIDAKRQTSYLRHRWGWAEESIWNERMLKALENGVKGGKWFSLIDKVYAIKTLEAAWKQVRANKGAAGVDEISIDRFEARKETLIREMHESIKNGTYRPQAVKRVYIPKGKGKLRPLGIPTVKDRVVQTAIKLAIEPIFEKEFAKTSFGFRPGRGCKDALRQVDRLLKEGQTWYVDADIQGYFDTIPHDRLMHKFKQYISDGALCQLVNRFLKHKIMEEGNLREAISGTPQGGVLSPLLANLYLHDLDRKMEQENYRMVRYADDFVILTDNEKDALRAQKLIHEWSTENLLTIHPEKSHIGNCMIKGQGFEFLGYRFEIGKRWVRQKSIMALRDKVREKTRRTCGQSLQSIIKALNPMLRGWYNYFKHVNFYSMDTFDAFVRRRIRAVLRKHNKRPGFGRSFKDHKEWPNSFFANQGLFTMEIARDREVAYQSR